MESQNKDLTPDPKKDLKAFTIIMLGAFVFFILVFWYVGMGSFKILAYAVGFLWNTALIAPGLEEDVVKRNQKLSFLHIVFKINRYILTFFDTENKPIAASAARSISPVLFCIILMGIFGGSWNLFMVILGSFLSESFCYLKIFKDQYETIRPQEEEEKFDE